METGTGKTYVYLRTIFELNKLYGFTKFVIVVPSRSPSAKASCKHRCHEGALSALYGTPFDHFVYDSKQLGKLRSFATSQRHPDHGHQYPGLPARCRRNPGVAATSSTASATPFPVTARSSSSLRPSPIVIVDEPQRDGPANRQHAAIERSRIRSPPCAIPPPSTVTTSLPPRPDRGLRAESGQADRGRHRVQEEPTSTTPTCRPESTDAAQANRNRHDTFDTGPDVKHKKVTIKHRDDLYVKSGNRDEYQTGFIVSEFRFEQGNEFVQFGGGQRVTLDTALGRLADDIMRVQIARDRQGALRQGARTEAPRASRCSPCSSSTRSPTTASTTTTARQCSANLGQWFEEAFQRSHRPSPSKCGLIPIRVDESPQRLFLAGQEGPFRDTSGEHQGRRGRLRT